MAIKKEMSKTLKISLIVLVVLVLAVGTYLLVKELSSSRQERDMAVFEQGFTYGYTNAVMQIMNVSDSCQPFPIYLGNQTRTLISVDCLRQA